MYRGTPSRSARASTGSNSGASRNLPSTVPLINAPLSPHSTTARSNSSAAAEALLIGRWAKAEKRSGSAEISRAILSLNSRAIAMPSGPETISAPGPGTESTCIRIPAASIAASLSRPVSASAGGLIALKVAVPGTGHPFRSNVAGSIRARRSGKVKCSSTATMRMFTLTTEPFDPDNPDIEGPLFRPARP